MRLFTTEEESKFLIENGIRMGNASFCINNGVIEVNCNKEGTTPIYTFNELWESIPDEFISDGKRYSKEFYMNGIAIREYKKTNDYPYIFYEKLGSDFVGSAYNMLVKYLTLNR